MFAVQVIEREPLKSAELLFLRDGQPAGAVVDWIQNVGSFAVLGLFIWMLAYALGGSKAVSARKHSQLFVLVVAIGSAVAFLAYAIYVFIRIPDFLGAVGTAFSEQAADPRRRNLPTGGLAYWCLTVGGLAAIATVMLPVVVDLVRLRLRRIWALARLSFIEVVRLRVLWVFLALLLVFLFPPKWFFPIQTGDEVRINVKLAYGVMMMLCGVYQCISGFLRHTRGHAAANHPHSDDQARGTV